MPIIENIAAKLAGKYLGEYFDGVERKNVEASLTSGETVFRNLSLKPAALDQFNLPVEIKEGTLAKLLLKVPWRSLGSEPTIVKIEELYITLGPKPRSNQTAQRAEELLQQRKKQRLKLASLLRQDQPDEDKKKIKQEKKAEKKERKKDEGKMSFSQTLQKKVISNLQLFIDKIHVRYEDTTTNSEQPFSFGFTLEKFHAQTANADWEPTIIKVKEQIVHKLIELRNLSLYFDTPKDKASVLLKSKNSTTAKLMSMHLFQDGVLPPEHNYLIQPLSGTMKLRMDQRRESQIDYSIPKLSCELELESAGFGLNKIQYNTMMEFLQYVTAYQRSAKYLKYRPDFETAENKARAYWKYALDCVRADIRKTYEGWSWDSIMARKKDRVIYVQLWTKRQIEGKKKLLPDELREVERIETKYSFDDLLIFRKLANTAIFREKQKKKNELNGELAEKLSKKEKKEKAKEEKKEKKEKQLEKKEKEKEIKEKEKEKAKEEKEKDKENKDKSKDKDGDKEKEKEEKKDKKDKKESKLLSAINTSAESHYENSEVMEELYSSIGYNTLESNNDASSSAVTTGPPPDYVKTQLTFKLNAVTLALSELTSFESRLANVVFKEMSLVVSMRSGGSMTFAGNVGKVNAYDFHTLGGRELVAFRPDPKKFDKSVPLLSFVFDKNPLDVNIPTSITSPSTSKKSESQTPEIHVDYRIKLVVFPIYITVSRPFIDRVTDFFKVSKGKSKKVGASVANKAASKIKKAGQKNLQKALKKRKVTQLDIDFTAPRIIVPESFVGEDCASMIIDFGHLVARSTGPPALPSGVPPAAISQAKKEALLYDHYDVSIKGITSYFVWSQTELDTLINGGLSSSSKKSTTHFEDWTGGASPNTLLRRLDVQLYVKLLSRAPTGKLARLKIDGSMSGLEVDLSKDRVGALIGAIRAATVKTTAKQHAELIKAKSSYMENRGGTNRSSASKRLKVDQSELIEALETADSADAPKKVKDKSSTATPQKSKSFKLGLVCNFEMPSACVVIHHQFANNPVPVPLISLSLRSSQFRIVKSTHDLHLNTRILGFYLEDLFLVRAKLAREDRAPYHIINSINQRGHALVQVDFTQTNKKSPKWNGVANNLQVQFNTLEVNLNRPTLAATVATIMDYVRAATQTKAVTVSSQNADLASPSSTFDLQELEQSSSEDSSSLSSFGGLHNLGTAVSSSLTKRQAKNLPKTHKDRDINIRTSNQQSDPSSTSSKALGLSSSDINNPSTGTLSDESELSDYSSSTGPKIDLKAQLALLAKEHKKEQDLQGPQKKKTTSKSPDKRSQFQLQLSVKMIRINFNRHTKTWFVARIGDIGLQLNRHVDSTMAVSGSLGAISAKDKHEVRWHDIVSIRDNQAAAFTYNQYRANISDYPGYAHSLNMHISSVRIILLQRLFKEIAKYFGGVSKMKKFAASASKGKVSDDQPLELQKRLEEEEMKRLQSQNPKKKKSSGKKEKTALKLHIELDNPLLVVPKTGDDPEHLQLDLGKILVTNSFVTLSNEVKVDMIEIAATGLNIRAFVKDDTTTAKRLISRTLLSDVNLGCSIMRPLANNADFLVPDIQISANMSKFEVAITEDELKMVLGTLSGNVSEFTLRKDDEMETVLKYLETAHIEEWLEETEKTAQTVQKPKKSKSSKKTKTESSPKNTTLEIPEPQTSSSAPSDSPKSPPNRPHTPLAKDARKVLDQVTRIKLSLKLNFDQLSATIYRGSGSDYNYVSTALARASINSFRLSLAQQADKGKVLKLDLKNIVLEDAAVDSRNQFRRLLASNPKDREDSMLSGEPSIPPTPRKSKSNTRSDQKGSTSDDEEQDSESSTTSGKMRESQNELPSDIENSLSLVYEARPKSERYEVVSIKVNRPRMYVVPSAVAGLIIFLRPLVKVILRTMSIFGKRRRNGSLGDQRRLANLAVEQMHLKMKEQLRLLESSQESKLKEMQLKEGSSKSKSKVQANKQAIAQKRQEMESEMESLKSSLEARFATFVAEVGKKVRSGMPKERTVKISLSNPEICVIEDPERSRNVFMVHLSDATIKVHTLAKNHTISLHLFELDARKGQVDPLTNETSERILLIQPFDVITKLEVVNEVNTKLNNIKIKIGVIHTIVSYRDMKLAMAVIRGFGALGKAFAASKKAVAKSIADNAIVPTKRFGVAETQVANVVAKSKVKAQLVLVFSIKVMNFTLLNDTNRLFVTPLLKIDIDGVENFLSKGYDTRLNLELRSIRCHAYNIDLAAYEPIVEPWGLEVLMKKESKATTVNIKAETILSINLTRSLLDTVFNTMKFFTALRKKKPDPSSSEDSPTLLLEGPSTVENSTQSIEMDSSVSLDTGSHSTSTSRVEPANTQMNHQHQPANQQIAERSFYPFIISNATCKPIKFWFSHKKEETAQYLEPEEECPIIIEKSSKQLMSGVGDEENSHFDIDVEIFLEEADEQDALQLQAATQSSRASLKVSSSSTEKPSEVSSHAHKQYKRTIILHKIPIDKVHSAKTYALPGEFSSVQFVSENVRRGGTKILTLRTTQHIVNNTAHDVEILVCKPPQVTHAPSSKKLTTTKIAQQKSKIAKPSTDQVLILVPSGKSKSIPLEFLNYSCMKMRTNGYDWCEWTSKQSIVGICPRLQTSSSRQTHYDYWSCAVVYSKEEDDIATYITITLHASLQFENLLASMVLFKILLPGETTDDVQNVVDVDPGKEIAIYQSHTSSKIHQHPDANNLKSTGELNTTTGDSSLQLTHQRFSFCLGGFYWSEPIDLASLYQAATTFKPSGQGDKQLFEKTLELKDVNGRSLSFIAEVSEPLRGCLKITIYAQYWIINQTGLKLNYRVNGRSPILVDDQARSTEIKGDPRYWYIDPRKNVGSTASHHIVTAPNSNLKQIGENSSSNQKNKTTTNNQQWRLAAPTKFYFSGDEFQAQVAGYGSTEIQQGQLQGKMKTVITAAMSNINDKFGSGHGASQWSNSLPLTDRDSKKHNVEIDRLIMNDVKSPRTFEFYCGVKPAPGKFWRTQEIRIVPQFVFINKTGRNLVYRQIDPQEAAGGVVTTRSEALGACQLMAGDQLPFHWPDSSLIPKQISINYSHLDPGLTLLKAGQNEDGSNPIPTSSSQETHWSGRFSIDAIDNLMVKIRDKHNVELFDLINVSIKERKGVKYVIFRAGSEDFIQLIRIENQSDCDIVVEQRLRINTSTTTASTETQQIANNGDPTSPQTQLQGTIEVPKTTSGHVQFTEVVPSKTLQPYYWDEPHKRTKVLLLHVRPSDGAPLSKNYAYSISSLAEDASQGGDEYVYGWKANSKQRFKVQVQVRGFTKVVVITSVSSSASEDIPEDGVAAEAVVDSESEAKKSTLDLEMEFAGIGLSVIDSFPQEIFYVSLKHATLKYQRVGKVHSFSFTAKNGQVDNQLYLAPDPLMVYGLKTDSSPFLSIAVDIDTTEKKIVYFTKAHMTVQRLELNVDQIAILAAAAFSSVASKGIKQQKMSQSVDFVVEEVVPLLADKYLRSDKYYFQNIRLEAIKSFFSLRRATNKRLLPIVNQKLKRALTTVLKISSIERQKLVFSGFVVPSAFSSIRDMQRRVVKHYKSVIMSNISSLLLNYVTKVVRTMLIGSIQPPVVQQRPPRFFPPDDLVVIYDLPLAYGQQLLRCLCEGAFYKEHYYFHYFISGQELLLSSHKWLLMCRAAEAESNFAIIWRDKLDDIISFVAPPNDITIRIFFDPHTGQDPHSREIVCRTSEQAAYIASKLDFAVARNKFSSMTSIRRAGED